MEVSISTGPKNVRKGFCFLFCWIAKQNKSGLQQKAKEERGQPNLVFAIKYYTYKHTFVTAWTPKILGDQHTTYIATSK